jgi:hypothetical protein
MCCVRVIKSCQTSAISIQLLVISFWYVAWFRKKPISIDGLGHELHKTGDPGFVI